MNTTTITNMLKYAATGGLFLVLFIPLYVNNGFFFPYITGKAFVFRIIVEIVVALWVLLMLRDKRYAPKFSWLSVAITLFTIVVFVADLLGVNPLRSLWSNFERMEGWVMIVHLWAYFLAAASIFGSGEEGRRMWHNFFRGSLIAASIVGIYGFFQLFGWAEIHQGSSRIDASLGNAAYMAVYMLINTFIAFYMMLVSSERRQKGLVWTYGILGIVLAFLLFETATRGTILGLVGGIMLALGIYGIFGKAESKKARGISIGVIVLIIALGAGLVAAKNTSFVKNHGVLGRLASISLTSDGQARQYIWPMAVKGSFESPKTILIGWGQENFNYIFNTNYNPKMWTQEQWFDRAHNVYLDWLVASGVIGLIIYISLFVLAIAGTWKSALTFKEKCLLAGLFVGYAIHNVFVFDNIASYLMFFTMLGFVHSLRAEKSIAWLTKSDEQSENMIVVRDYVFLPLVIIALGAALYFINIRPIQANTRLIAAMTSCGGGGTPSAELYARALELNQTIANQEIREQLLSCGSGVINSSGYSNEQKTVFYDLIGKELQNQIKASPLDARSYMLAGAFFDNIRDWKNGTLALEKALLLSPNKQTIMFELGTNYINVGREKEAAALFKKAYESAPENDTAQIGYITGLILTGEEAKAREIFKSTPEIFLDTRVLAAYGRNKNYQKVFEGYKILIEKNPDNIQYYATLAATYFETKQYGAALTLLNTMKTRFPQAGEAIDAAIKQINDLQ